MIKALSVIRSGAALTWGVAPKNAEDLRSFLPGQPGSQNYARVSWFLPDLPSSLDTEILEAPNYCRNQAQRDVRLLLGEDMSGECHAKLACLDISSRIVSASCHRPHIWHAVMAELHDMVSGINRLKRL